VEQWGRASELMHSLGSNHGYIYLHVLQPNQYIPDSKRFTASEKLSAYKPQQNRLEEHVRQGYPKLQQRGNQLRQSGVRFIDATMGFADSAEDLYIDACCHFNSRGNETLWSRVLQDFRVAISSSGAK
jgi:hypothetical protein